MVVIEISKIIDNKKLLKNNYSDISSVAIDELSSELNSLSKKEFNASSERRDLERKKNHYNIELEKIRRYKDIVEEVVNKISKDPYYQADTEEEYKMLVLTRDEKLKMMDDFYNETNDYSKVHFNSSIGDSIQYTEESKKLFKKL